MQAVVQQEFVSLCISTQADVLQQMRTWSKGLCPAPALY